MVKSELIANLAKARGITPTQAADFVNTIFESMQAALCAGEGIEIRGFGAFHVNRYPGYQGRNPVTGLAITVRPKRRVLFRMGRDLQARLNEAPARPGVAPVAAEEDAAGQVGMIDRSRA